jgi:hypothetical protein
VTPCLDIGCTDDPKSRRRGKWCKDARGWTGTMGDVERRPGSLQFGRESCLGLRSQLA